MRIIITEEETKIDSRSSLNLLKYMGVEYSIPRKLVKRQLNIEDNKVMLGNYIFDTKTGKFVNRNVKRLLKFALLVFWIGFLLSLFIIL